MDSTGVTDITSGLGLKWVRPTQSWPIPLWAIYSGIGKNSDNRNLKGEKKKLISICNQVWPQYELGNLKWSKVLYAQIFMALENLGNGTQNEFNACAAWRDNSRKDTEDI